MRRAFRILTVGATTLAAAAFAFGCDSSKNLPRPDATAPDDASPDMARLDANPPLALIDLATTYQTIVGFGAASGWTSPTMDDAHADLLFTADKGIGLSLLRMRIAPDGTTLELATGRQAIARGASVWETQPSTRVP